jgi:hypothetical protein
LIQKKPPLTSIAIPGMTWSFDLPNRLKLAIADAMTILSRIECIVVSHARQGT